ncbi:MAG: DAK2 domain-containing protein [Mycobacterium pseudokansasii]|uniref:DAK2 domain-containing protein n=1 Tax=Mycobacterium pseudokansasii TaxID=2341080 RepID=UPI000C0784BC|nr:DAK2 domain-containing protein [Mycobacterium pseudokansasii]MBY0387491.1 DAK2 domain-containing protein [Mycobacterium pseudokansasii]
MDASALRDWAHTVVSDLITHIDEINRLNVFPVADSDTGANMLFTMRAALAEADAVARADDGSNAGNVARVAAALSSGALNGARGNSGVIVSQILRGIADVTASAAADAAGALPAIDAVLLAAALWRGVELVIASMGGAEVPGTIVSVLRAAAAAVEQCAGTGETLAQAVTAAGDAAVVALEKTPEQLDVLADAGVVDAGGRGLVVMLDALRSTLTGHAPARSVYEPAPRAPLAEAPATRPAPQFEVMYLLTGCDAAAADTLRDRLAALGDSVALAAAPSQSYSVHVHTDDAGAAVEAGIAAGQLSRIVISALSSGVNGLPAGSWTRERAVLAVVDGDGAAELFAGEGACVLRPGPDASSPGSAPAADISAHQLVRAVVDTGAAQVMVLPNGYVAVEELVAGCTAALGWGVDVVPVPTGSMVQGLAALAVHDPASQAVDDGYTMARAAGAARHGSVRTATERALTWAGTCEPGDGLGIAGDEVLIVARDVVAAAIGLLDLLLASGGDLVTVLVGTGIDDEDAAVLSDLLEKHMHDRHPGTELVTYRTGHRGDALLIGVE